ncbi:hypothetical protein [Zobellella maritima]|uniref:hypothetical protein n=1 Tax=Zobellella maritima TaxID=2059725 RepID=UPI000E30A95C|nr:hypothetical protein [Zobellella maritima]
MNIDIYPRNVLIGLLWIITGLLLLNVLGVISSLYINNQYINGFVKLFNFDRERNIPAIYSSAALFLSGFLLFVIAMAHRVNSYPCFYWLGLTAIFLFLSFDEMFSIHERLSRFIRESFDMTGLFYFSWVIPYGLALVFLLLFYIRFLIRLPRNTIVLFFVSGLVFVSGAIGFEMVSGSYVEMYGRGSLFYALLYTCEEFFEMLGVVIFIYALLMYIVDEFKVLAINVNDPNTKPVESILRAVPKRSSTAADNTWK